MIESAAPSIPGIGATARRWFLRGMAAGLLIMGAVNAVSYFFRSPGWKNLTSPATLRPEPDAAEAIGFPWQVWEAGNTYGGMFADYPAIGWNVLFAMIIGSAIGILCVRHRRFLSAAIGELDQDDPLGEGHPDGAALSRAKSEPIQFSLGGLMIATAIAAVFAMVASKWAAHPAALIVIYGLGPLILVALAMLPRRLSWQRRVALLIPTALSLIAVAMGIGQALGLDFDRVLMGIFLCWTPQSALAAIVLASTLFYQARQEQSVG